MGHVEQIIEDDRFWRVRITSPANLARYIAMKGSICVDGTSLTVNQVAGNAFDLTIIPQTWEETVFSEYRVGSPVNLEVDVIARYLERMMQVEPTMPSRSEMADFADIEKIAQRAAARAKLPAVERQQRGGVTGFVMTAAEHCQADHIALWRVRHVAWCVWL
ncbi:MAG: hypothetical protein CM15mP89_2600 [Gammaproteobacteria bacterium]|nr:MAG: hypothetical protein CM15mP89_2600 [Gammaproteobacteria bacterium]